MNAKELAKSIAKTFGIALWEATSRVEFNIGELEIDPNNITPNQAGEIERGIAADIRAGK